MLTEIPQIIAREMKLFTFWLDYGHWISFIISVLVTYWIFTWFPSYLFKSLDKIEANTWILKYNLVLIFLGFLITILIMLFAPGIFIFIRPFGVNLGNFYLIILTIKAIFDVLTVSAIWKTLDTKIREN